MATLEELGEIGENLNRIEVSFSERKRQDQMKPKPFDPSLIFKL